MLHNGQNEFNGLAVEVVRRKCRRINLRVLPDGSARLTIPIWGATLRDGEEFLIKNWAWLLKHRTQVLALPPETRAPLTTESLQALQTLLEELNALWANRLGTGPVTWKIRRLKSVWGCCHWLKRQITYNAELVNAPRELVEYIVVHEFTHFDVHGHGPDFYRLMDERLPGWKTLRKRLRSRNWFGSPHSF